MRISCGWWRLLIVFNLALLSACSPDVPEAVVETSAAKVEPLEALPPLRTGTRALAAGTPLAGSLKANFKDQTHEYLEIALPAGGDLSGADRQLVELDNSTPGDLAVLEIDATSSAARILVRRRIGVAAHPGGALYLSRWREPQQVWERVPFKVEAKTQAASNAKLKEQWLKAFATHFADVAHPWFVFAAGRLQTLLPGGLAAKPDADGAEVPVGSTELTQLMKTTSGMLSVQEALQYDRGLRLDRTAAKRNIAITSLAPPPLAAHPFAAMQASLSKPDGGVPEPLATAVPAEFWYARVDDIRVLLRLLDEADAWITPVVQTLERSPEDRQLSTRYQTQLGLRRSGMAKLLGHAVVGQVAITGSDPYLREGSDITLIFSVKQQAIFDQELARHLDGYKADLPGLTTSTREHAGVRISVSADSGASVRQQRAQIGDRAIVSNSPRAIERVIDAIQGKVARLADEPDLKYLLACDPGSHQLFAFLSDRFIAAVVGPQQKVLAARRQQALAELLTPGYAALLHGWLFGQPPVNTEALLASALLHSDELAHADGEEIRFTPGFAATSAWGRPSSLTPLIDLPAVTEVSEAEKLAYEGFVTSYQQYWKQFIDPVALRLDLADAGGETTAQIDVRILPLISASDYNEILEIVGSSRVEVQGLDRGVQAVWAVGADARLRKEFDGLLRSMTGSQEIGLGWLGNWVALGLDDRAELVELLSKFDDKVQLPPPKPAVSELEDLDLWQRVGRFPIYAAAEVKNPVMLIATLTAIRTMLGQVAPGATEWGESGRYRDLPIVRVGISKTWPMLPNRAIADAVALHYVQTGSAFVLALNPETLHRMIDRLLDGKVPKAASADHAQFVVDARSRPGAPLWTALLWLIQGQANESQGVARRSAEILMRGESALQNNPELLAARALAYFGSVPLTPQGDSAFLLRADGAGDALSGTLQVPSFVELPIPGSPIAKLMQRLTRVRAEVSFDPEPAVAGAQARSLHTRFSLNFGEARE